MSTSAPEAQLSSGDKEFMNKAAHAGHAEIQAAELALGKTNNEEVRLFAQRMINDHSKANDKLKDIAAQKNFALPDGPSEDQMEAKQTLSEYNGEEFDAEYIDVQVDDHETVIDFFQNESVNGSDLDLKRFATDTLPTLKEHLRMAQQINDEL